MKKTIALIAHDGKKADMVGFVKDHIEYLRNANIIATGTTGSYVAQTGLEVELKLSGPKGGDAQIAALTAEGTVDGIILGGDPLDRRGQERDGQLGMLVADLDKV